MRESPSRPRPIGEARQPGLRYEEPTMPSETIGDGPRMHGNHYAAFDQYAAGWETARPAGLEEQR